MREAKILFRDEESGTLIQHDDGSFTFRYTDEWIKEAGKPPISLTLPITKQEYNSDILFPFFYNMLPEGSNKEVVCRQNRIDPDDWFGLLLITARYDTIGAVRIVGKSTV